MRRSRVRSRRITGSARRCVADAVIAATIRAALAAGPVRSIPLAETQRRWGRWRDRSEWPAPTDPCDLEVVRPARVSDPIAAGPVGAASPADQPAVGPARDPEPDVRD